MVGIIPETKINQLNSDPFVIGVAVVSMIAIAIGEQIFLKRSARARQSDQEESHAHHHRNPKRRYLPWAIRPEKCARKARRLYS